MPIQMLVDSLLLPRYMVYSRLISSNTVAISSNNRRKHKVTNSRGPSNRCHMDSSQATVDTRLSLVACRVLLNNMRLSDTAEEQEGTSHLLLNIQLKGEALRP